jgi:cyclopropane fatty-acyl-phospholipid synthase-like methyltransferase
LKVFGEWDTVYEALSQLPKDVQKSWFDFDHYYSDTSFAEALPIVFSNNPKMIYDVGGNTGKFTTQCIEYTDDVNVTMVDLPGQLGMAKENFKSHPSSERVHYYEMNLLDQDSKFEGLTDVVWMSQFLDCFSKAEIVSILSRVKTALKPDGSIYIMETFCDRQKYPASEFSLLCTSLYFTSIANGNSRMYNLGPFVECVELAGLKVVEQFDEIGVSHSILKCQLA